MNRSGQRFWDGFLKGDDHQLGRQIPLTDMQHLDGFGPNGCAVVTDVSGKERRLVASDTILEALADLLIGHIAVARLADGRVTAEVDDGGRVYVSRYSPEQQRVEFFITRHDPDVVVGDEPLFGEKRATQPILFAPVLAHFLLNYDVGRGLLRNLQASLYGRFSKADLATLHMNIWDYASSLVTSVAMAEPAQAVEVEDLTAALAPGKKGAFLWSSPKAPVGQPPTLTLDRLRALHSKMQVSAQDAVREVEDFSGDQAKLLLAALVGRGFDL